MVTIGDGADQQDVLLVRQGDRVVGFVNACPHMGVPLDWQAERLVVGDGSLLRCAHHGALFRIADGLCVRGPCVGDALEPLAVRVARGMVFLEIDGDPMCRS